MVDIIGPADRSAIEAELRKLDRTVATHFPDAEDRAFARRPDRQGIGGPQDP